MSSNSEYVVFSMIEPEVFFSHLKATGKESHFKASSLVIDGKQYFSYLNKTESSYDTDNRIPRYFNSDDNTYFMYKLVKI